MDEDRWRKVSALFHEASQLPPDAVNEFLAAACGDDDELRLEVTGLLNVAADASGDIEDIVDKASMNWRSMLPADQRIGPYRILDLLGRGGMGQVFLAERADDEFERRVAIKTIGWMAATPELIERFRKERQILANLDHPHIARLLDGGRSDDGVPYLVMEYVDGKSIIEDCNARGLTIPERLQLLLKICDAVQFAHRNLVIHRDIKPSNILITAEGAPKLLDFGIAKLLESGAGAEVTRADLRVMTPEYASPEQLRGEAATTATDVYGLGLLLYQLLTGRFPYDTSNATSPEIERIICRTEPAMPSVAVGRDTDDDELRRSMHVGRRELAGRLAGDLDNIVMMALRKEPERRYETVKDLATDIGNYLASRPVTARTASLRYRTSKFVARNRTTVAAATTAIAAIVAMTVFHTARLSGERDLAEEERRVAEEATQFMVDLFSVNAPDQALGAEPTAREVLDRGALKLDGALDGALGDSPRVRARLLLTLGRVYERLGQYGPARTYLEQSIELYRNNVPDAGEIMIENLEELAWIHYRGEDWAAADAAAQEALALREASVGPRDPSLARVLNHLGTIAFWRDDLEASLGYYDRALALLDADNSELRKDRATTLNHLGITYDYVGRDDEAERAYIESLDIRLGLFGENHPDTATAMANLAAYYANHKDWDRAAEFSAKALQVDRAMHGNEHANVAYDLELLAAIERGRGQYARALEYAVESSRIWAQTLGEEHSRYISSLDGIAVIQINMREPEAALASATRAADLAIAGSGAEHTLTADALYTKARALRGIGRLDDARDAATRAAAIRLAKLGGRHPAWWDTQQLLGQIEYEAGNLIRAAELVDGTLDFVERQQAGDVERRNTVLDLYIAILESSGENPRLLTSLKSRRE
jgi:serine/threonine-protein kinase